MKAVIIAAGCGSRLEEKHHGIPKSLLEISGKRIIDDIISKISQSGVKDIVIVTGFRSDLLEAGLENYRDSDINIEFVHNPDWKLANGISIFKAKERISPGEEFLLLMSDHIFDQRMLQKVIDTNIQNDEALLALDFKIDQIPDLDDGMKIQCLKKNEDVYEISLFGKTLTEYSAIDAGMFKFNFNFFEVLEKTILESRDSLSDSCTALAQKGKMLGLDIGEHLWLDVDTPEMIDQKQILKKIFL